MLYLIVSLLLFSPTEGGRTGYPIQFQNRQFTSNIGIDWLFGTEFSPIYDFLMWKAVQHTNGFFTEFHVRDFSAGIKNINYHCLKYKVYDGSTIFIWVFETISMAYNDPIPNMCQICNGVLSGQHRLTDNASGSPFSKKPPPALTGRRRPAFCENKRRYY